MTIITKIDHNANLNASSAVSNGAYLSGAKRKSFAKSSVIYCEEQEIRSIYCVEYGVVILKKYTEDGRCQVLDFVGPGEFIDLSTEGSRDHFAEAATDVSVSVWPASVLETNPQLTATILKAAKQQIAKDRVHILMLGRLTAEERLARFVQDLSNKLGEADKVINHQLSRQQIADFTGLTIETVSRQFSKWRKDGTIEEGKSKELRICNPDYFRNFALE